MYELAGLNAGSIAKTAMLALGMTERPQVRIVSGLAAE
jgi:hypothetical protein